VTGPARLHRPIRTADREPCGPTALSALTGRPAADFWTNRRKKGMSTHTVREHLHRLGFSTTVIYLKDPKKKRTLAAALPVNQAGVAVTHDHFLAFSGWMVVDTLVPVPIWVHDHPWRQHRVRHLVLVWPPLEKTR
jgi:hypothetical protein